MSKRNKKFLVFGLCFFGTVLVVGVGLKYIPFTKVMKLPAGAEKEFTNPQQLHAKSPNTLYYDFEIAPGKDTPSGFYKGIAHSGKYSVKAFGQNSYSLTIERIASEIGMENLKAVALSAWIYVFPTEREVKGTFVFAASNELGVNICWQGVNLREPEVPRGKWFKISGYIDLTSVTFKPNYKIQVYFWNNSKTDILIDDYTIVFGGPVDRRGDSARVDMTKPAGFSPRFNEPPFPVTFLEKEEISIPLKPDEFHSGDFLLSGNFLNTGNDDLLMIDKQGKPKIFTNISSQKESRKIVSGNPGSLLISGRVKTIGKGKFLNGSGEQFVVFGEKGWAMGGISQNAFQTYWKSANPLFAAFPGDFNGDHQSELLSITEDGAWKILTFQQKGKMQGDWIQLAKEPHYPIGEWNVNKYEYQIFAGHFLQDTPGDILLTVFREKSTGKRGYSLRKFKAGQWISCFSKSADVSGKTIGLDTLKPSDHFYIFKDGKNTPDKIYRYNRDWRFDLKEVRFNDSTFQIIAWVDFHGYPNDNNPKYYESLALIPGKFCGSENPGFLVVGKIAKERNYVKTLPDFVQFFTIPKKILK
ncbi:MAG: hypothetical protein M0P47_04170 [Bacteroidales bacterium]|nr:hypothetical protein [Bacteroidales bacterium]